MPELADEFAVAGLDIAAGAVVAMVQSNASTETEPPGRTSMLSRCWLRKRHADERIDFRRFDLDSSLAVVPENRCGIDVERVKLAVGDVLGSVVASACAAARLTVGCGYVSAG